MITQVDLNVGRPQPCAAVLNRKKNRKKEGLLEAAYQLFLEKGVNKTSVDEIVKKANVAKVRFILYFHDKPSFCSSSHTAFPRVF